MEQKSSKKQWRPGNTYHVNDVRWMRGGCRDALDFIIERSKLYTLLPCLTNPVAKAIHAWLACHDKIGNQQLVYSLLKMVTKSRVLPLTGKKIHSQIYCACIFSCAPLPLRPPHVTSHDKCSQPFPIFTALLNTNQRAKKKKQGRAENEATTECNNIVW